MKENKSNANGLWKPTFPLFQTLNILDFSISCIQLISFDIMFVNVNKRTKYQIIYVLHLHTENFAEKKPEQRLNEMNARKSS